MKRERGRGLSVAVRPRRRLVGRRGGPRGARDLVEVLLEVVPRHEEGAVVHVGHAELRLHRRVVLPEHRRVRPVALPLALPPRVAQLDELHVDLVLLRARVGVALLHVEDRVRVARAAKGPRGGAWGWGFRAPPPDGRPGAPAARGGAPREQPRRARCSDPEIAFEQPSSEPSSLSAIARTRACRCRASP